MGLSGSHSGDHAFEFVRADVGAADTEVMTLITNRRGCVGGIDGCTGRLQCHGLHRATVVFQAGKQRIQMRAARASQIAGYPSTALLRRADQIVSLRNKWS